MRYAVCYVSTSTREMDTLEMEDLLNSTSKYNNECDIRGILLYSTGNFFQILEGEKELIIKLFGQISKDTRHHSIIQVVGKTIKNGAFDGYKAEIVLDSNKCDYNLVKEYMLQVEGLDSKLQGTVKRMMEVFIDTR